MREDGGFISPGEPIPWPATEPDREYYIPASASAGRNRVILAEVAARLGINARLDAEPEGV